MKTMDALSVKSFKEIKSSTTRCSNRSKMDTKTKKGHLSSEDMASQNQIQFFTKNVTVRANSDVVLLDNDSDVAILTEIKSETPFPDFFSQNESECFTKHLVKQIKSENTCSSWDTDTNTEIAADFGLQDGTAFFQKVPVMKVKKYSTNHEMDNKIKIPWQLETETSPVCDDIEVVDSPPVKSPRLCTAVVPSAKSPCYDVSGKATSFYNGEDHHECESQSEVIEVPVVKKYVHSEQCDKCNGEIHSRVLYLKHKYLIHKCKRPQKNGFTHVSSLKSNEFILGDKMSHECNISKSSSTQLSSVKLHNSIPEGKKSYKCQACNKRFASLSYLEVHNFVHERKKPHKYRTGDKRPYKCETCEKTFTDVLDLKWHNLHHKCKKPHKCKTCEKSFTVLSDLKWHNLHQKCKKSHKCETVVI